MSQLIDMADDPDARVRTAAFHALACDRCKSDACAPGAGEVLEPALRHLASDPDPHVRAMATELAGKFVHTDSRAATALETARAHDARLRHASAKSTLDTYGHIWPDRDESTRAAVDAAITAWTEQGRNSGDTIKQRRRSGPV